MRILNIQNVRYDTNGNIHNNYINFKSSKNKEHVDSSNIDKRNNSQKPLPEWARKAMLGTLVLIALKNEPVVQNWFKPDPTQEELDKIEYYEDIQKIRKEKGVSSAFYHVGRLNEIEAPKIKALGDGKYQLDFKLDNRKIGMNILFDENNKDTIKGSVKIDGNPSVRFKAIFPSENKDEFKVMLLDKENKRYIFGRDYFGELYKVENGKKQTLNRENVEEYEKYQEALETLDDWSFFTNENPLWRNLNYLLLIYLLFMEAKHDSLRRKQKENENTNRQEF